MIWRRIAYAWNSPSAFHGNWRKYTLNQGGHALAIGTVTGLLGIFWIVFPLYIVWEATQWQFRRAAISDCLEDIAFVLAGGLFGMTLQFGYLWLVALFLASGAIWRAEEKC